MNITSYIRNKLREAGMQASCTSKLKWRHDTRQDEDGNVIKVMKPQERVKVKLCGKKPTKCVCEGITICSPCQKKRMESVSEASALFSKKELQTMDFDVKLK